MLKRKRTTDSKVDPDKDRKRVISCKKEAARYVSLQDFRNSDNKSLTFLRKKDSDSIQSLKGFYESKSDSLFAECENRGLDSNNPNDFITVDRDLNFEKDKITEVYQFKRYRREVWLATVKLLGEQDAETLVNSFFAPEPEKKPKKLTSAEKKRIKVFEDELNAMKEVLSFLDKDDNQYPIVERNIKNIQAKIDEMET